MAQVCSRRSVIDRTYSIGKALTHLVAFHAQQAIEKSLKSLLESRNQDVPKTHSLNRLFALIADNIQEIPAELIHTLDGLYIDSRYPGEFGLLPDGKPSLEDAQLFYDFAVTTYQAVFKQIRKGM
jgi:HEPN domain-containing protein